MGNSPEVEEVPSAALPLACHQGEDESSGARGCIPSVRDAGAGGGRGSDIGRTGESADATSAGGTITDGCNPGSGQSGPSDRGHQPQVNVTDPVTGHPIGVPQGGQTNADSADRLELLYKNFNFRRSEHTASKVPFNADWARLIHYVATEAGRTWRAALWSAALVSIIATLTSVGG